MMVVMSFFQRSPQLAAKIIEATNTFSQVSLNPTVEPELEARVLLPAELEQVCVSKNYVQQRNSRFPQRCSAKGDGLTDTEIDSSYHASLFT